MDASMLLRKAIDKQDDLMAKLEDDTGPAHDVFKLAALEPARDKTAITV